MLQNQAPLKTLPTLIFLWSRFSLSQYSRPYAYSPQIHTCFLEYPLLICPPKIFRPKFLTDVLKPLAGDFQNADVIQFLIAITAVFIMESVPILFRRYCFDCE